jgi:hypothetical protein
MRGTRAALGLLLAALLGAAGCRSTDEHLKPPKNQEEYTVPPDNDRRYSGPIEFPKETMEQDVLLKRANDAKAASSNPAGRFGGLGGGAGGR